MKPTFKTEQARHWYRICKRMAMVLAAFYVIAMLVITVLAAMDNNLLASPIWGLFMCLYTLPVVLPATASFFLARKVLIVRTNALSPGRKKLEMIFAVVTYALVWLASLFIVLWLAGLYLFMHAAIACAALALLSRVPYYILIKKLPY